MLKVTKKINHDSLWVKITDTETKSFSILHIGRSGSTISYRATENKEKEFKLYCIIMDKSLKEHYDLTYGELLDLVEGKLKKSFINVFTFNKNDDKLK